MTDLVTNHFYSDLKSEVSNGKILFTTDSVQFTPQASESLLSKLIYLFSSISDTISIVPVVLK